MAVNLTNADNALKSYYLDAVSEQLDNKVSPFLAQIKKTTDDVWGKDVKKLLIHGINGGIGSDGSHGVRVIGRQFHTFSKGAAGSPYYVVIRCSGSREGSRAFRHIIATR